MSRRMEYWIIASIGAVYAAAVCWLIGYVLWTAMFRKKDPSIPVYSPFQGGIVIKTVKMVCLAGFVYSVALVIALERKDRATVFIGVVSFGILTVVSLKESFAHWHEVSEWHKKRRATQFEE